MSVRDDAKNTFKLVLAAIRRTGHPLYLLIDEYDNFANEVMVRDGAAYNDLVHGDGPFKELMKTVKAASQGQGLERLFVTGVCLLRRFDRRLPALYDLVFELKYVRLGELEMTGEELRGMDRDALMRLEPVSRRLEEAEAQLRRYRAALTERYDGLRPRLYAVVSLGFERLVARELKGGKA